MAIISQVKQTKLWKEANRVGSLALCLLLLYGAVVSITGRLALPYRSTAEKIYSRQLSVNTTVKDVDSLRLSVNTSNTSPVDPDDRYAVALPQGVIFGLFLVVTLGLAVGYVWECVGIPPLLGMLLLGIVLRNTSALNYVSAIGKLRSSICRKSAFVIILLQGGLGINPSVLLQLKAAVFCLAFIPCIVEACVIGICCIVLLGIPWQLGLMMGFVLGAVSPAICVPGMLRLKDHGYGVDAGIPSLVIAASSVDDVGAITGFSILLSLTFSQGSIIWTIIGGPVEVCIGILYGCFLGTMLWYFPHANDSRRDTLRVALLLAGGFVAMFGSAAVGVGGAGALGCVTLALVSNYGWIRARTRAARTPSGEENAPKADGDITEEHREDDDIVGAVLSCLWTVMFEPLLFCLIGAELDVAGGAGALGAGTWLMLLVTLGVGLLARTAAAFLALHVSALNVRERVFVSLAWLPKATVQAALGPVVYDTAIENHSPQTHVDAGLKILTMAVLAIVLTAPLGAILIAVTGPKLLTKSTTNDAVVSQTNQNPDSVPLRDVTDNQCGAPDQDSRFD